MRRLANRTTDLIPTLTREALYARVWAEPIPALAAAFGIPPSALRQVCRDADVPLPGRGYWVRLHAGKPVVQTELPPRGSGDPRSFVIVDFHGGGRHI